MKRAASGQASIDQIRLRIMAEHVPLRVRPVR